MTSATESKPVSVCIVTVPPMPAKADEYAPVLRSIVPSELV